MPADAILQINIDKAYLEDEMNLNDDTMEQSSSEDDSSKRRLFQSSENFLSNTLLQSDQSSNSSLSNSTSHGLKFLNYDYEFAYDNAVLGLSDEIRAEHGFQVYNVSMMTSSCFGSNSLIENMIPFGGVDIVVMNAVKYTVDHAGTLTTSHGDYYFWTSSDYTPYSDVAQYLKYKFNVLFGSLFSFFAISTLTALLVRVLISSGVVILFPLFWGLQVKD